MHTNTTVVSISHSPMAGTKSQLNIDGKAAKSLGQDSRIITQNLLHPTVRLAPPCHLATDGAMH